MGSTFFPRVISLIKMASTLIRRAMMRMEVSTMRTMVSTCILLKIKILRTITMSYVAQMRRMSTKKSRTKSQDQTPMKRSIVSLKMELRKRLLMIMALMRLPLARVFVVSTASPL
jgi:hypothetical protein